MCMASLNIVGYVLLKIKGPIVILHDKRSGVLF